MALLTAIDSLAEREARRERAQNEQARDSRTARIPDPDAHSDRREETLPGR